MPIKPEEHIASYDQKLTNHPIIDPYKHKFAPDDRNNSIEYREHKF